MEAEAELGRPEIAATVELFDGEKRALVQTFLSQQTLPDAVNEAFVAAVNDALQGMERLAIPAEDLLLAVAGDGTPCSPKQFRQRFGQFVAGRLANHDGNRLRISLDW